MVLKTIVSNIISAKLEKQVSPSFESDVEALSKIKELYPFEADFNAHYTKGLAKVIKAAEEQRLKRVQLINRRAQISLGLFLSLNILIALLMLGILGISYHDVAQYFNYGMQSYHQWWQHLPGLPKFVLPAHLVIWDFPGPIALSCMLSAMLVIRSIWPIFTNRPSIKNDILPRLYNYMGDFYFAEDKVLKTMTLDDAMVLPAHSSKTFSYASIMLDDYRSTLHFAELKLARYLYGSNQYLVPSFMGLLIMVDLEDVTMPPGHHIMLTDPEAVPQMTRLINHSRFNTINLSQHTGNSQILLYSEDEQPSPLMIAIARLVAATSTIINQHNGVPKNYMLDEQIIARMAKQGLPDSGVIAGSSLECVLYQQKLFLLVPVNRELFAAGSIFVTPRYHDDIHITLATINLAFGIVDLLKGRKGL